MPELCRFAGIVIRMYYNDYPPPHFHAEYGDPKAKIEIKTLEVLRGQLPTRQRALVIEWATARESELLLAFERAMSHTPAGKIEPLD